jgi:MFS family permease
MPKPVAVGSSAPNAGWRAVSLFTLFYALAYLDRRIISFLVDPIQATFHVTDFQLSLVQGLAFVLSYALFTLPIGWAVDRWPRRRILFLGLVCWSIFSAACGLARSYGQLLLARLGVGAGEAALHPAVNSFLADIFPKERLTTALAVFGLGGILGASLSVAVGGAVVDFAEGAGRLSLPLIGEVLPWQFVFLMTGLPGLVVAFLVFTVQEPARTGSEIAPHGAAPSPHALAYVWRHRRFFGPHFIGFSLVSLAASGFTSWAPARLMRSFDLSAGDVGATMAIIMLVMGGLGMLLPGLIVDRMMRAGRSDAHLRYYVIAALALGAAGCAFGLAPSPLAAFASVALVDLTLGFFPIATASLQLTTPPRYRGQVTALFLLFYNLIGQGLGPSVVAAISDFAFGDRQKIGVAMSLTFLAVLPLAAGLFAYGLAGMRRAAAELDKES